jgi:hypothetical protein
MTLRPLAFALLWLAGWAGTAHAQTAPTTPTAAVPTLAARTAGLERRDGFLPFYWDAAKGQLLIEVSTPGDEFASPPPRSQRARATASLPPGRGLRWP